MKEIDDRWPIVCASISSKRWVFPSRCRLILLSGQLHLNRHSVQLSSRTPPAIVSRERREKPGSPPSSPATTPSTIPNPSSFHLCALGGSVANSGVGFAQFWCTHNYL